LIGIEEASKRKEKKKEDVRRGGLFKSRTQILANVINFSAGISACKKLAQ
jgi:hypothetical protein